MDHLFTPWRYAYIKGAGETTGCIFCDKIQKAANDEEALIVHRARFCYICLNAFPYTNGHVMVVPYAHEAELNKLGAGSAAEMMSLIQHTETVLRKLYAPDGINLGMNIGKAAGAGVAGHVHMHVLPRWFGDTNFMATVSETRVLPESLDVTWKRMKEAFAAV